MFKGTNSTPKFYSTLFCLHPTGQTGCHCLIYTTGLTGQTGPRKTEGVAHTALKCTTRRTPSLGASLHDLPPLCIPADELDTAGAEVHVRVSCNNNCGNKP